jgi:general secretion pathway protein C
MFVKFDKIFELPWRVVLVLTASSFVLAQVVSTTVSIWFAPQLKEVTGRVSPTPTAPTIDPTPSLNKSGVDSIVQRNLFNLEGTTGETAINSDSQSQPPADATTNIPKTDLPLKLWGTIYAGDASLGIAIVENTQRKSTNSFMVGDTLMNDAVVHEVYQEKIIIKRGSRFEYLDIAKTELHRSLRRKKAGTMTPGSSSETIAPIATEPPPPNYKEEGFERKEREITMSQTFRAKLLTTEFTKVLQDAKATPNMVDGELKGFVLTRIRKESIYEKAGLQNDDIVEEINGVPLTDVSQSIKLLNSLRNESEIEVRVIRGGVPQKFTLSIK